MGGEQRLAADASRRYIPPRLRAMLMPSKVEVPRPISSRMTRLSFVAFFRISATSVISTMKVDCPAARSSDAPTRVKMASTTPMRRAGSRHEAADLRHQRDEGILAHVGGFAGHIGAGDDAASGCSSSSSSVSLGTNRLPLSICSMTGWRPSADLHDAALINGGHDIVVLHGQPQQSAASTSSCATAAAVRLDADDLSRDRRQQIGKKLMLQHQQPLVRAQDLVLQLLQLRRDVALPRWSGSACG